MKSNAAEIYQCSVFVIVLAPSFAAIAEGYKTLLRCNVRVEMMFCIVSNPDNFKAMYAEGRYYGWLSRSSVGGCYLFYTTGVEKITDRKARPIELTLMSRAPPLNTPSATFGKLHIKSAGVKVSTPEV